MDFEINLKITEKNESFKKFSGEADNLQRNVAITELFTIILMLIRDNAKSTQEVIRI